MITRALIALNVLVFVWEMAVTGGGVLSGNIPNGSPVERFMLIPGYVLIYHQYYRMVSAAFLHGSILHIAMNMLFLYSVGRFIEAVAGAGRTLAFYLISLVVSSAAVVYFSPVNTATLGASGAIFGMFGALFAIGLKLGEPGKQMVRANVGILVLNLVFSFAFPGISWQAHVGGLIAGFIAAYILYWPPKPVYARVVDQHSGAQYESELEGPP